MLRKIGALAAISVIALVAYFLLRGSGEADAEARYDGVHLCSPSQQAAATAAGPVPAGRRATPSPSSGGQGAAAALFAQNDPVWGSQEYDHGKQQNIGCGSTIAQCGCAMTSVATVLRLFQNLATPDGTDLSPASLNSWFNKGAQLTSAGWVSQGYMYGSVVWTAVNNFSAAVPAPLAAAPGSSAGGGSATAIRYKGWGSGSVDELKRELSAGRPVVLEVPGHFIAAVGLDGDTVLINDPYYKDRTTLDAYAGRVKSSRLFEPGQDLRALTITVPANQRVKVTDSQGRVAGTLAKGSPADAEKAAKTDIPGAMYHFEEAWRDPTCTERPPPDGAGVNTVFIPNPDKGTYTVEVLGARDTGAVVYSYDRNGNLKMETHGGGSDIQFQINYDLGTAPAVAPASTATPVPAATGTPAPAPTAAPAARPAATAAPTDTPPGPAVSPAGTADQVTSTPTEVPGAVTPTPTLTPSTGGVLAPGTLTVKLSESRLPLPTASAPGCQTLLSWEVKGGDSSATVELLRNSVVIYTTFVGPASFTDPFAAGTWNYQVRATNTGGQAFLSPQVSVTPFCLSTFSASPAGASCSFTLAWQVLGTASGNLRILRKFAATTTNLGNFSAPLDFQVIHSEALVATPRTFTDSLPPSFLARDYEIEVAVQNRTVDSIVHADTPACTPALQGQITIIEDQFAPRGSYGFTGDLGGFTLVSAGFSCSVTPTPAPPAGVTSMDFNRPLGTYTITQNQFPSCGNFLTLTCTDPSALVAGFTVKITITASTPHVTCTFSNNSG